MLPGRELTIRWLLKAFARRRWLVIGPFFLGALGGLLYSRSQPSLYRSDGMVQVVPQRIPDSYVQSTITSRVEDRLSSIAQQVLSRTQLEALILQFNLYPDERRTHPMEDVVELMTQRVEVAPVEGSSRTTRGPAVEAFRVSFEYNDPQIARDVAAKLVSFFIDRNATERGSQANQTSAFLEAQLDEARGRLEAQDKKLKDFRERYSGRLPTQSQANMQAIQTTQLALQAAVESLARDRDRKLMLERLYGDATAEQAAGAAAAAAASPASSSAGDPASKLPADAPPRQRLDAVRKLLEQMELHLSPKHPDVIRAKRLIEDLEKQVAAEDLKRPLSPEAAAADRPASPDEARRQEKLLGMRAEIESLDRQVAFKEGEERRLRGVIADYQARLEAVPGIESQWVALTRDYDTLQASYRELLSKSENSKMAASLEQRQIGEQFGILDPPRVPVKPRSPDRIRINLVGTLAGLGLGLLLAAFMEHRDSTMRSEADLLGAMDLPVLVLVPYVTTEADVRRKKLRRWAAAAGVFAVLAATGALAWFLQLWKYVA